MIQPVPMILRVEEVVVVVLSCLIILYFNGPKLYQDIKGWFRPKEASEVPAD